MKVTFFTRPQTAAVLSSISILLLGYFDYVSGWEFGFFVFYFLPIIYTAWYCRLKSSVIISVLSAAVWFFADYSLQPHYSSQFFSLWNSMIRLCVFLLIVFSIDKIKKGVTAERKISDDLRTALTQIKTLRGLIPICASCKKIRNDQGYWEQIEKYITEHSEADFTHGLCETCARKLYPEAFGEEETSEG
ncbi:MAG: DUF4118 domain-containing protein [Chitinispirillaceae bacterium]|nr:DUF4118 domain-containing protein [Chitinispirillaceae bacterium]